MALGAPPPPEEDAVAVVVRVRPPSSRERAAHPILRVVDQHILVFNPEEAGGPSGSMLPTRGPRHQGKDLTFVFDRVFGEEATQEEVFQHTTRQALDSVLNGYNCSVFAYGATGAGKTYTMLGSETSPGIMYLTMVELYKRIEARKEEQSCEVLVSYQEVYNEQIHDLLEPKGPLPVREDPEKGVVVQGLSFHQPTSAEQLLEMLANGNKNRTQHPTDANATSSRSHAIFQIHVKQQDRIGGLRQDLRVAKMSLVDLAGSERALVANTKGERLREGANINRSLLALINVINALADAKGKKSHIPYRDSKLTRLLKDSIGGNCRTIMIAAISPSELSHEDTYNTLKYASRAKEIKLALKSNVLSVHCPLNQYAVVCEQLKAEVRCCWGRLGSAFSWALKGPWKPDLPGAVTPPGTQRILPHRCPVTSWVMGSLGLKLDWSMGQSWAGGVRAHHFSLQAPEEMPPNSPRASCQAELQLGPKKPSCLHQDPSSCWTEALLAAVMSVARKQFSLLKTANLLTPDMVSEFEELERLVPQEASTSLEQTLSEKKHVEAGEASQAPRMQQGCDDNSVSPFAEVAIAMPSTPVPSAAPQCVQQLALLSSATPVAPTPAKRRSELNGPSPSEAPCDIARQVECQRSCGEAAGSPRGPQNSGSPVLQIAALPNPASPLPLCCPPCICPLTVIKRRLPPAAQSSCSPGVLPLSI
ncbi:KI18B protein, partial [Atlantisia rogersi]|nr:KI18B protein [Atlantisia rogersi]